MPQRQCVGLAIKRSRVRFPARARLRSDSGQVVHTQLPRRQHSSLVYGVVLVPLPFFYRAMLCIRGTSHGPVSVCLCLCLCLSVTSRCSTKTAKRRITQTTPHDTPGTLVFLCQRSPRNSTGVTPYEGAECRWGGSKSATFDK